MTATDTQTHRTIVHVAVIHPDGPKSRYLFLRKIQDGHFCWFEELEDGNETETKISAGSVAEAMGLAGKHYALQSFRSLGCGYRFTLPERDEIGRPALFQELMQSYAQGNGIYFDPAAGHNCIVNNASQEAQMLWRRLKTQGKVP